jgi:L-rhamnose isomerase/sugar isomerase
MAREMIDRELLEAQARAARSEHEHDFAALARQLARRGHDVTALLSRAASFSVAIPSWGVGTGGTRFGRFPQPGEPRDLMEKLEDCAVVQQLVRITPRVALHIPWDRPSDPAALRRDAAALGLSFDSMNSNTFEDHTPGQLSYKFGSLTHVDAAVREQAVGLNLECIEIGRVLGAESLTVWIGDGGNFPGQIHLRRAFDRYVDSLRRIAARLPSDWRLFLEHKLCEPAFYSTVNQDWGSSHAAATAVGPCCSCLVDLGHHAPNVNIELIVARLIQLGKLGGFHFNDSKYGDDDLDAGAIKPYQLFLIFHELVSAEREGVAGFAPAYLLDQSHNVTDPIESLLTSAVEVQRACIKAWLVDRAKLEECQQANDALGAAQVLKAAYETDVGPLLAEARLRAGGAFDPLAAYRASSWRRRCAERRPVVRRAKGGGIVG